MIVVYGFSEDSENSKDFSLMSDIVYTEQSTNHYRGRKKILNPVIALWKYLLITAL